MGTEKPRSTITFEEDVYDGLVDEHDRTGKDKSQIVNDHLRHGLLNDAATNWFLRSLSQALFVVGFVIAFYESFGVGLGTSFFGLGLMLWSQMQEHAADPNVGHWEAFKRTLGVY